MADYKVLGVVAVMLIVIGVVLSMGSKVTQDLQTDLVAYTTVTGAKQSWNPANSTTALTLNQDRIVTLEARNATGNELLTSANYTLNTLAGTVILTTNSGYNGTNLNLTYSYETEDSVAYDSAGNSTLATGKLAKYLPLLSLVLMAAIILGTVFAGFRLRK